MLQTKSGNKDSNVNIFENASVNEIEIITTSEEIGSKDRSTILHVSNNTASNIEINTASSEYNFNHKSIQNENNHVDSFEKSISRRVINKRQVTNNCEIAMQILSENQNNKRSDQVLSFSRKSNSPESDYKHESEDKAPFKNGSIKELDGEKSESSLKIHLKKCTLKLMKLSTEEIQNWSHLRQNKKKYVENTTIINLKTSEKIFTCTYCNKSFSRKHSVIAHERTHTGEKTFECKYY